LCRITTIQQQTLVDNITSLIKAHVMIIKAKAEGSTGKIGTGIMPQLRIVPVVPSAPRQ
jgi:hypothetical protein